MSAVLEPPAASARPSRCGCASATQEIRAFATTVHDLNPLHHDLAAAQAQGYRGLIATGSSSAASYGDGRDPLRPAGRDGRPRSGVGMSFEIRFRAPVHADEEIDLRWTVIGVERKDSLERLDHAGSKARPAPA